MSIGVIAARDPTNQGEWIGLRFDRNAEPARLGYHAYLAYVTHIREAEPSLDGLKQLARKVASTAGEGVEEDRFLWYEGGEIKNLDWFYYFTRDGIEVYHDPIRAMWWTHKYAFRVLWGVKPTVFLKYKEFM